MAEGTAEDFLPTGPGRAAAIRAAAAMAALLLLDGQLGPLSFTLRRAAAMVVLASLAWLRVRQIGGWRIAGWAVVVAVVAMVARAPSASVAIVGFVVALAAIEVGPKRLPSDRKLAAALVPACISYVALRFVVDLVPQARTIAEAVSRGADGYISRARGFDNRLSFTALGGPAVAMAVLYLLWSWRRAGRPGPLMAAVASALGWFALQPVVAPDVSEGSLAVFSWGAGSGLFWLGAAAAVGISPARRTTSMSTAPMRGAVVPWLRRGERAMAAASRGRWSKLARPPVGAGSQSEHASETSKASAAEGPLTKNSASRRLALPAAIVAAALAGACLVGTAVIGPPAGSTIRVHNLGGLDWERPVFGQFGAFSGGMFGLLPVYCRAGGYDFEVIDNTDKDVADGAATSKAGAKADSPSGAGSTRQDGAPYKGGSKAKTGPDGASPSRAGEQSQVGGPSKADSDGSATPRVDPHTRDNWATSATAPEEKARADEARPEGVPAHRGAESRPSFVDTIEPRDLDDAQILLLINSPKVWDERERRTVLDFVARGGSLLILGDHTDVFGLMRGFNSLLGPFGIQFRFDSAYKARETWRGCQAAAPDAIAWGWDDENPGVAVGASLELSGSARPLLVGRYGFSDNGVRENTMGSFLGNYHYDKGEQLGDVVLAATTTYGRGRIVVWGDTSAFQGVSNYWPTVVGPLLAWLSRPAAWTERPPFRIAAALGLLAAIVWLWIVRGTAVETGIIAASLLAGLLVPRLLSLPNMSPRRLNSDWTKRLRRGMGRAASARRAGEKLVKAG